MNTKITFSGFTDNQLRAFWVSLFEDYAAYSAPASAEAEGLMQRLLDETGARSRAAGLDTQAWLTSRAA